MKQRDLLELLTALGFKKDIGSDSWSTTIGKTFVLSNGMIERGSPHAVLKEIKGFYRDAVRFIKEVSRRKIEDIEESENKK